MIQVFGHVLTELQLGILIGVLLTLSLAWVTLLLALSVLRAHSGAKP